MHESYVELKNSFLPMQVWTGFYTFLEVVDMAVEGVEYGQFSDDPPDEVDKELIHKLVREEFDKKAEAENSWPAETDCDRLMKAFEKLTSMGIVSVENNAYTISDGWAEWSSLVDRVWAKAGVADKIRGGCFYHGQDLERAVTDNQLWLAFDVFKEASQTEKQNIGRQICDVLTEFGFTPEWDGSADKRITLPIKWTRRYGPGADGSPMAFVKMEA